MRQGSGGDGAVAQRRLGEFRFSRRFERRLDDQAGAQRVLDADASTATGADEERITTRLGEALGDVDTLVQAIP